MNTSSYVNLFGTQYPVSHNERGEPVIDGDIYDTCDDCGAIIDGDGYSIDEFCCFWCKAD